jgi:mRNA interferase MazF
MRRGEIRPIDLEPARGSEAKQRRPAILVSNEGANAMATQLGRGVLQIVPLTSSLAYVAPYQVVIPASESGLRRDSKAQAEQVRAVDLERIGPVIGVVPPALMNEVDEALRIQLAL